MDDVRCPKCAALVTAGAAWCSLCFHDLRPAPPQPEPEPVAQPLLEPVAAGSAPRAVLADPAVAADRPVPAEAAPRGRHARREPEPAVADAAVGAPAPPAATGPLTTLDAAAEAAAEELLAALRHESRLPSSVGGVLGRLDSTGAKVGVMVGGVVLVTVVLFALMALVGSFL